MRKLTYLFLFFTIFLNAQTEVYDRYPFHQDFYKGGLSVFYKDIRKVIKKNKLMPCSNEDEKYLASVLVYSDKKINFVKDFDTINIQKNKCAFDLSKSILPYLDNWQPAKVNGKEVNAITQFMIDPYFLFHNKYKKVYLNEEKPPVYEKSLADFQYEVKRIIESYIKENISGRRISLSFTITETGLLQDLRISNLQLDEIKEKDIIRDVLSIRGKWKPGTRNGLPVKYRMNLSFVQGFNFDLEKQKFEEMERGRFNR